MFTGTGTPSMIHCTVWSHTSVPESHFLGRGSFLALPGCQMLLAAKLNCHVHTVCSPLKHTVTMQRHLFPKKTTHAGRARAAGESCVTRTLRPRFHASAQARTTTIEVSVGPRRIRVFDGPTRAAVARPCCSPLACASLVQTAHALHYTHTFLLRIGQTPCVVSCCTL